MIDRRLRRLRRLTALREHRLRAPKRRRGKMSRAPYVCGERTSDDARIERAPADERAGRERAIRARFWGPALTPASSHVQPLGRPATTRRAVDSAQGFGAGRRQAHPIVVRRCGKATRLTTMFVVRGEVPVNGKIRYNRQLSCIQEFDDPDLPWRVALQVRRIDDAHLPSASPPIRPGQRPSTRSVRSLETADRFDRAGVNAPFTMIAP